MEDHVAAMARLMTRVGGLLGLDRSAMVQLIALLTERSPEQVEAAVRALSGARCCQDCDAWRGQQNGHAPHVAGPDPHLTAREREVAVLVAAGSTNAEIADRLRISRRTVEKHVDNIRHKLGAISRAKLISWTLQAQRRGVVTSADETVDLRT
jgi:DNA-binding CsgD family transcriptional regulator